MTDKTDRELLELAARAVGLRSMGRYDFQFGLEVSKPHNAPYRWNPLKDEGDALRLAVKMRIQIAPGTYNKYEFSAYSSAGTEAKEYLSSLQDDLSATCRAIVRAAAEIGRAMQ